MSDNILATTSLKKHYKVTSIESTESLFPDLDLSNPQLFSKKYIAEEGEILYIELHEDNLSIIKTFVDNISSTADLNIIPTNCYDKVNLLYVGIKNATGSYDIKFQRIWNKYYFKKTWFSLSLEDGKIAKNNSLIMLTGSTDMFWDATNQRLYFKNFRTAKGILPKLEKFYRQANAQDLEQFSKHPLISMSADKKFGERALRRIASIIDDKILDDKNIDSLQKYAEEYSQNLPLIENGKFKVNSTKDIDILYKLANELFYTTKSNEKRATNSFQKID